MGLIFLNQDVDIVWQRRGRLSIFCFCVTLCRGEVSSADLGGSSKYSNENLEGRSGEVFHVNSSWTCVS